MILKRLFFVIGLLLFLVSLPLSSLMIVELGHNLKMQNLYGVTTLSDGYPPTPSTFTYQDHTVTIEETMKDEVSFINPWSYEIGIADLAIKIDGKVVDRLLHYPVRIEEEGLNRYYGDIGYLMVRDKKTNESHFVMLIKKTREIEKEKPDGGIVGSLPAETLQYEQFNLGEDGQVTTDSFTFEDRSGLQTELLNVSFLTPYGIGFYTDAWKAYPVFFFPLTYPFGTLVIGFVLTFIYFPFKKKKETFSSIVQ
ncbi:hypothetical protein [Sporosarcina aquimarina]|uniref:Uncharacterized protein n=1 Tax=Sporosarcina aquimarina TaxID=114975 RepID=A0ABU4G2B1_9BACL|nr:hypothetical protein [Sporosarcina aquimarina]MDW0111103.1 hypothetical protein [Sporosarcina aquimarina]